MTTKPEITLKNIKYFAAGSQETPCYTASIYVDGNRFATVENSGHGGPDNIHPITGGHKALRALNTRIEATYPHIDSDYIEGGLEPTLEHICGELLDEFLLKKSFKRAMRRVCYVKPSEAGVYQFPAKYKPTPELIARIKATAPWAAKAIFLADLPEHKAFELFKNYA